MAGLKTQETDESVDEFIEQVDDEAKRADCQLLLELLQETTGEPPKMWGKSMVGFGSYHYVYESGREGDWFRVGFAPRARNISIYVMSGFSAYDDILGRLGTYKTGKSCLYVKRLDDVDLDVLRELIEASLDYLRETYGE